MLSCLKIIYNDIKKSSFADLLAKDGSANIHRRNLQVLVTEMFKVHKNTSTELTHGLFCVRQTRYKLRIHNHFAIPNVNSAYQSISNLWPRIWNLSPDRLKELNSISSFKNKTKRWQPKICPCRFCKSYIPRVGFLKFPTSKVSWF